MPSVDSAAVQISLLLNIRIGKELPGEAKLPHSLTSTRLPKSQTSTGNKYQRVQHWLSDAHIRRKQILLCSLQALQQWLISIWAVR